jgi:hypothetical protein
MWVAAHSSLWGQAKRKSFALQHNVASIVFEEPLLLEGLAVCGSLQVTMLSVYSASGTPDHTGNLM